MSSNRITEGVGKKIVEALKKQSDIEIIPVKESEFTPKEDIAITSEVEYIQPQEEDFETNVPEEYTEPLFSQPVIQPQPTVRPSFNQTIQTSGFSNTMESVSNELDGFEIPTNVAVLKQLISKLPSGVTKQTGAQIIKQTMEALGISMNSVLQEAQQVQEGLNASARDCQSTIVEYRKQINLLEKQAQKYQRQYTALNDIISLFIQTSH